MAILLRLLFWENAVYTTMQILPDLQPPKQNLDTIFCPFGTPLTFFKGALLPLERRLLPLAEVTAQVPPGDQAARHGWIPS